MNFGYVMHVQYEFLKYDNKKGLKNAVKKEVQLIDDGNMQRTM